MTDSSDCESDAGASPSVTSDESEGSTSSSSSTPALKIVCEPRSTPRKRNSTHIETPGTSSSTTLLSSPVSTSTRKPTRRQILESLGSSGSPSTVKVNVSRVSQIAVGKGATTTTTSTPIASRKRRRLSQSSLFTSPEKCDQSADPSMSPNTKRKRNKRRRTRSERNIRSGKGGTLTKTQLPAEGEVAVALDAEIDRVLEEKAIKNNLSATNVKSIIRHVITNNMVQKMIMSTMRKKAQTGEGGEGGCSSDEDGLLEPKMTRAKTKELLENKQTPLWPIVESPMKKNVPVSETHMLIHNDLPEDSSGDEYLPKDTDIAHSDDESSSVASVTSDVGSPAVSIGVSTRRSLQAERSPFSDPLFKTPPPPPKAVQRREESAISRRTRSKLPLNDTPLEDLERQLVPPDITNDMYDWGETDNEDYLAFLKDFLFPGQNIGNEMGDDDEADPEYNVMEDDEDVHDKEELRRDRAVKVPKKELNELVAELIEEYHVSSGDDLEDHDITSLTSIMPFINDSGIYSDGHALEPGELQNINCPVASTSTKKPEYNYGFNGRRIGPSNPENSVPIRGLQEQSPVAVPIPDTPIIASKTICPVPNEISSIPKQNSLQTTTVNEVQKESSEEFEFRECDIKFLQHQMRQHIQLLAQSYVLTVTNEDSCLKYIATTSKRMIIELQNFALANGANSNFAVCSLEPAWNLVNYWPHKFLQQSPIKKKILEEKYITESCVDEGKNGNHHFPRHVVKIIAENPIFLYNKLLPESYHQKIIDNRCKFTTSEDALIVGVLDEFKSITPGISASQLAEAISDILLPAHPPIQVYHRIRNLRRVNHYCDPTIKRYFLDGILPIPDRTVPEIKFMIPLLQRDRTDVSLQWQSLLQHVEDSSTFGWEERLNKDPVTKSLSLKNKKSKLNKMKVTESKKSNSAAIKIPSIKTTFPNGAMEIEKTDPNLEAMPLVMANGKTGAVILIPKYALNPAQYSTPRKEYIFEPREGQEAEKESYKQELPSSSVKVLELNHLIRKSRETPLRRNLPPQNHNSPQLGEGSGSLEASKPERSHPQAKLATTTEVTNSNGMYQLSLQENISAQNFVAVGKPFDLPELNFSGMAGNGIINLTALETPMKRVVFEKVSEQASPQPASGDKLTPNSPMIDLQDEESCNVIEEGTEFELTSDSEFEDDVDMQCYEEPELVALSSDDDMVKGPVEGGDGRGSKSDSPPKKTDGSTNSSNKQSNTASSASTPNPASSRRTPMRVGRGDDSDEEHNKPPRKRPLPKDAKDDNNSKEEDNVEKDKINASHSKRHSTSSGNAANAKTDVQLQSHSKSVGNAPQPSSSKSQKKVRRSPGNQGSRRVSKYNVTPAEKMLEEEPNDFDDVADAYMESYLAKVHSVTETKHPGLYATFVQLLIEAGEKTVNQAEVHSKVKALFKDYPDLLKEFESFLDPTLNQTPENSTIDGTSGHEETLLNISFIQKLEKFTENCPNQKTKVMNKVKSLKENPDLTEKDIVAALEPCFIGNPVMMDSFKALFQSIYRPQSVSLGMDFEEIELEMEDPPRESNDDLHFETVKLPEETAVPATNTCPCSCHLNTSDTAFTTRSKHCKNCSLKFQDGKIFIHNGKVLRPVSVELSPLHPKPSSTSTTPVRGSNALNLEKVKKESAPHTTKSKEFKEPEMFTKSTAQGDKKLNVQHTQVTQGQSTSSIKHAISTREVHIEGENPESDQRSKSDDSTKNPPDTVDATKTSKCRQTSRQDITKRDMTEWTEEEDTIILSACQQEPNMQIAWRKMASLMPHRPLDQIKSRCSELIALLQSVSDEDNPG